MGITILGFDPGLKVTGWGFIEKEGSDLKCLDCGEIELSGASGNFQGVISFEVRELLKYQSPDACAVEDFVAHQRGKKLHRIPAVQNILMGKVVGIITEAIYSVGLRPTIATAPAWEIKKAVTGQGKATKGQVRDMVRRLLDIKKWEYLTERRRKISSHCADALAAAIWYAHSLDVNRIIDEMSKDREGG